TLSRELIQRLRNAQQQLDLLSDSLRRRVKQIAVDARALIMSHGQSLKAHDPKRELIVRRNNFVDLHRRFAVQLPRSLQNARERFRRIEDILRVLGPDATLERGYSITTDRNGNNNQSISSVRLGDK